MKYVLFKTPLYGREVYWTGEFNPSGTPKESYDISLASRFSSARAAYDVGGDHGLWWWKAGER